jgi:chaperonin cofactor prefoldin
MEDHSVIEELKKGKEILEREIYRGENNNKKLNEEINLKMKIIKEKENESQVIFKYLGSI